MIKDLDKLARMVHSLAIDKGWWCSVLNTTPIRGDINSRDMGEMLMLAVSELAEAMEETRKPGFKPNEIYYLVPGMSGDQKIFYHPGMSPQMPGRKPEGFPIELADCVIRLLDTCCAANIELQDRYATSRHALGFHMLNLPPGSYLMRAVADLAQAVESPAFPGFALCIADCIARLDRLAEAYDIDLEAAILLKHNFNKTRPFRHGNKLS